MGQVNGIQICARVAGDDISRATTLTTGPVANGYYLLQLLCIPSLLQCGRDTYIIHPASGRRTLTVTCCFAPA